MLSLIMMFVVITSPPAGTTFLTTQNIVISFVNGPVGSYQISPGGSVVTVPAPGTSPLTIPPITTPGTYMIRLNNTAAGGVESDSVVIKVVEGPPPPGGGGASP